MRACARGGLPAPGAASRACRLASSCRCSMAPWTSLRAALGSNKSRGIGRYSLALAQAMARRRGDGDLLIALNSRMEETIEPLRTAFRGLIPEENVRVWQGLPALAAVDPGNDWRRGASE